MTIPSIPNLRTDNLHKFAVVGSMFGMLATYVVAAVLVVRMNAEAGSLATDVARIDKTFAKVDAAKKKREALRKATPRFADAKRSA